MAVDLKRLDPVLPVETMGIIGDDDLGRFLLANSTPTVSRAAACGP